MNKANFNISRVLREIWLNPGISRIELSNKLELDKSTISLIVASLVNKGLIQYAEEDSTGPRGGRKKVMLELIEDFGFIAGLEIQSDYYRLVVINLRAEIIHSETGKMFFDNENLLENIESIIAGMRKLRSEFNLLGIGIGFTGIVNNIEGSIQYSIPLKINKPNQLTEQLEEALKIPVLIENDANCGAWTELSISRKKNISNFIFVLLKFWDENHQDHFAKVGVGLGIVLNGQVYHGANYTAGEFKSVFSKGNSKNQFAISDEEIEKIPDDPECTSKMIKELSANMSLLVNTFNLEKVIVGCNVSIQQNYLLNTLSTEITNHWHYPFDTKYEVTFSGLSKKIVSYGASLMFLERIFELSIDNKFRGIKYLDPTF